MKTNTQIQHDCALCSGFSPQPHVWPRVFFLLLPPCWIWAPAENLWELRLVSCPRRSFLLPGSLALLEGYRSASPTPALRPSVSPRFPREMPLASVLPGAHASALTYTFPGLLPCGHPRAFQSHFKANPHSPSLCQRGLCPPGVRTQWATATQRAALAVASKGWCIFLSLGPQSGPEWVLRSASLYAHYGYHVGLGLVAYYFCLHLRNCLSDALSTSAVSLSGSSFVPHQWLLQSKIWICQFPP